MSRYIHKVNDETDKNGRIVKDIYGKLMTYTKTVDYSIPNMSLMWTEEKPLGK